jgi:hypothetical protein
VGSGQILRVVASNAISRRIRPRGRRHAQNNSLSTLVLDSVGAFLDGGLARLTTPAHLSEAGMVAALVTLWQLLRLRALPAAAVGAIATPCVSSRRCASPLA